MGHSTNNKTNKIITVNNNNYIFKAKFRSVNNTDELMSLTSKLIETYNHCYTDEVKNNSNNNKHGNSQNKVYTLSYEHGVSLQWYSVSQDGK